MPVTGAVRADARAPGRVRAARVTSLEILGASVDFPITPKEHGTQFLFEHRHLWLRSRRQVAIARVRHEVVQAIRDFFYQRGFTLVDTPILTGSIGEQAGELFATDYFDLGKAYLAQTGQLYVEAAAAALGKVYCFGPTFRAEKSKTRRHLTEFWMVEPEVAFNDSDDNMRLQEDFVSYLVARALERAPEELKELERDTAPLERVTPPFPRITYTDAVDAAQPAGLGHAVGRRPRRRRRDAAGPGVRPAALRLQLSQGRQGLLHEGESGRSADGAEQRLPGARRATARSSAGRSGRTITTGCWPASRSRGSIRRRIAGTSTSGSTAPSCTRGSGSASSARWPGSAASRTSGRHRVSRQIHRLYP